MKREKFVVTPWEVRGRVDYDKLMKQFGIQPLTDELIDRIKKHMVKNITDKHTKHKLQKIQSRRNKIVKYQARKE